MLFGEEMRDAREGEMKRVIKRDTIAVVDVFMLSGYGKLVDGCVWL